MTNELPVETHPWAPFAPPGAKVLIMGTFPPSPKRWCMDFYYPNPNNDFWKMCGLLFLGDAAALYVPGTRRFDPEAIRRLMTDRHIALHDTCRRIRRLQGNASDKFLEVVETVNLDALLQQLPDCRDVATTGEKAASIIAELTATTAPRMGRFVETEYAGRSLRIWRMPSTSRAYPLALEKKAEFYAGLFRSVGVL
ncbi:MAG: uracil-DNA glycosylase family protein [Muribaculaceae bacterium]|nr:uracil-DNA glycosylase family protein [Muribaculaceae bacterium]